MFYGQGYYRGANAVEYDIPDEWFFGRLGIGWTVVIALSAETYTDGAGNILHNNIREREIFDACPSCADLDGAAIGVVNKAIRDGDILGGAATKTKNRPARTERAIGYGYEFIAAK
jgi:hypothetical protein